MWTIYSWRYKKLDMNILIIGGNRFVGKLLAQQLSTQSLTLINRTGTGPKNCKLICVYTI